MEVTNEHELKRILAENSVVLVNVYGTWCGHCKMLKPSLKKFETQFPDIVFVYVNSDEGTIASSYGVRGLPTTMIFVKGEMVERIPGNRPDVIEAALKKHNKETNPWKGSGRKAGSTPVSGTSFYDSNKKKRELKKTLVDMGFPVDRVMDVIERTTDMAEAVEILSRPVREAPTQTARPARRPVEERVEAARLKLKEKELKEKKERQRKEIERIRKMKKDREEEEKRLAHLRKLEAKRRRIEKIKKLKERARIKRQIEEERRERTGEAPRKEPIVVLPEEDEDVLNVRIDPDDTDSERSPIGIVVEEVEEVPVEEKVRMARLKLKERELKEKRERQRKEIERIRKMKKDREEEEKRLAHLRKLEAKRRRIEKIKKLKERARIKRQIEEERRERTGEAPRREPEKPQAAPWQAPTFDSVDIPGTIRVKFILPNGKSLVKRFDRDERISSVFRTLWRLDPSTKGSVLVHQERERIVFRPDMNNPLSEIFGREGSGVFYVEKRSRW